MVLPSAHGQLYIRMLQTAFCDQYYNIYDEITNDEHDILILIITNDNIIDTNSIEMVQQGIYFSIVGIQFKYINGYVSKR